MAHELITSVLGDVSQRYSQRDLTVAAAIVGEVTDAICENIFSAGRAAPAVTRPRCRAAARGIPLPLIQRQLGHSHRSTTGTYLQGIDTEEIISTVHARRAPMMHASAGIAQ